MQDIKLGAVTTKAEQTDSKTMLAVYCQQKNFDPPKYSFKCTKSKKFVGEVYIEGVIYSTDPIEYIRESVAEDAAASVALENIKEFPISRDSCEELSYKIHECLRDRANGIYVKFLPNIFE